MSRKWWVLTSIGVGTFMSALDGSVVNTILPVLRGALHTSVAGVEWVATIYLLVVSALLMGVGRAGDLRGQKRMYVLGFIIFVAGSALCGASVSARMLVTMRALQAIGASMLYANSPAILTKTFSAAERGRALGAQATFTYLGLTAGPSLGGWLAHAFGWRSVFYINVPVGAIGVAIALKVIDDDRPSQAGEPFDFTGAALFATGLVSLLVALNEGAGWGWTAPGTLALFAVAIVLLAIFIVVERRHHAPMLDLSLFQTRTFSASTAAAWCNYVALFALLFVLPFLLIQGRGLNTEQAGIVLTAQPIVMAVVAPISGAMSDRIGSRPLAVIGMVILCGGLLLLAWLSAGGSLKAIAGGLAIAGFGTGLFVSPNNSSLMGAAPRHRQGIAAGVLATARNVGMVCGIGIGGAVFQTILVTGGGIVHGVRAALVVAAVTALLGSAASLFISSDRGPHSRF